MTEKIHYSEVLKESIFIGYTSSTGLVTYSPKEIKLLTSAKKYTDSIDQYHELVRMLHALKKDMGATIKDFDIHFDPILEKDKNSPKKVESLKFFQQLMTEYPVKKNNRKRKK